MCPLSTNPRRAAILAVYAAESLLLAFALKLRVGAALAGQRGAKAAVPAACAALGLDDGTFHRAASFLGQCMPTYVQQPGASRPTLKVRCCAELAAGWPAACLLLHAALCCSKGRRLVQTLFYRLACRQAGSATALHDSTPPWCRAVRARPCSG